VGGRAQEGTTALSITYTDDHSVRCCPTAGLIEAMADYSDQGDLTATPAEIEAVCKGNTATAAELSELHESGVVKVDLEKLHNITLSASQINAFESLKNDFEALRTCFSGSSAPGNPVAGMWWYDTTANMLKIRNEANDAWLNVYDFANSRAPLALLATNCSRTVVAGNGISVSGTLASGNVTVSMASAIYAQLQDYTAGTRYLWHSGNREYGTTETSMTKVADLKLDRGGSLRIDFTMYGPIGARGRIYRNESAIGTLRTAPYQLWNTYSEDISGWSAGDSVQIYASTPSETNAVRIKDFSLRTGNVYGMTETM